LNIKRRLKIRRRKKLLKKLKRKKKPCCHGGLLFNLMEETHVLVDYVWI